MTRIHDADRDKRGDKRGIKTWARKKTRHPADLVSAVFDIETSQWDVFVAGMLKTPGGRILARHWTHEEDFVRALLSIDGVIWSFNGGRFDMLWVADWCAKLGIPAEMRAAGQRIISMKVGRTEFRDISSLVPFMSLGEAGKMAGRQKTETSLPCKCIDRIDSCGGYCSISRAMKPRDLARLMNYLEDDCDTALAILDRLFIFGAAHNIDWSITVGATAWKTAAKWYGLPEAQWTPTEYRTIRKGYYGGRTQVFRPELAAGWKCDINSAYPYALTKLELPTGDRFYCGPSLAAKHYSQGREGIYECTVLVSESDFLPALPFRARDRIAYPTGRISGAWTALELRHAEKHGASICEFSGAVSFGETIPLLRPFCERIWSLRAKAQKENDPIQKWLKTVSNSLSGKLAQKPDVEVLHIDPTGIGKPCPGKGVCASACSRKCGAYLPVGRSRNVFSKPAYRLSGNAHVHWAAYLTAHARAQLHTQLATVDSPAYCDTDSCFARGRGHDLGDELGQWKDEGRVFEFLAHAPKTYRYHDDQGEVHGASKGIPNAAKNFDKLRAGVKIDRGVLGIKSACAYENGALFRRKNITRRLLSDGKTFGDRILRDDGLTYPQDVSNFAV